MNVMVDAEFESLLPKLDDKELEILDASIAVEGVRDPLVVWNGIVLDGHNRYRICKRRGITPPTIEVECADRDAAKEWILVHQLGRRNLSSERRALCIGELVKLRSDRKLSKSTVKVTVTTKAVKEIAQQTGVSEATAWRAKKFADAVDAMPEPAKAAVIAGKSGATMADVASLADATPAKRERAAKSLAAGRGVPNAKPKPTIRIQDETGQIIDDPDMQSVFACRENFTRLANALVQIKKEVKRLADQPAGAWLAGSLVQQVCQNCDFARDAIKFATPYALTPVTLTADHGEVSERAIEVGFITKDQWNTWNKATGEVPI